VNLHLRRGDYFAFRLRVPTAVEGEYEDIASGYEYLAQIRQNADAEDVLATLTVTPFDDGPDDRGIELAIDHADSALLPKKSAWDCQLTDSEGRPRTWFAGTVNITKDVSRAVAP
jgi:hypothetical protein